MWGSTCRPPFESSGATDHVVGQKQQVIQPVMPANFERGGSYQTATRSYQSGMHYYQLRKKISVTTGKDDRVACRAS